jgi:hypothetical protein
MSDHVHVCPGLKLVRAAPLFMGCSPSSVTWRVPPALPLPPYLFHTRWQLLAWDCVWMEKHWARLEPPWLPPSGRLPAFSLCIQITLCLQDGPGCSRSQTQPALVQMQWWTVEWQSERHAHTQDQNAWECTASPLCQVPFTPHAQYCFPRFHSKPINICLESLKSQ